MQNDGEFFEPFEMTNWVKRGCVMAPTLFSAMFSVVLMDAFQDSDTGFPIGYRFDDNVINIGRLQADTKVRTDVLDELLYTIAMDKRMPAQRQKCKGLWIKSHIHVITMISQSAQKRQR